MRAVGKPGQRAKPAGRQGTIADAVQNGLALHRRGMLDDAERIYAGILKLAPAHFDALHLLGLIRRQRGDTTEALRLIGAALKVRANSADALSNYGEALVELQRYPEALTSLDSALAIAPDHVNARVNRATALIKLSRFAEALTDAGHALRLDPRNQLAWMRSAYALSALGQHERAIASCDAALALNPADPVTLCNRGYSQEMLGRAEDALASYDAALALVPNMITALVNHANALADLQREDEAAAGYEAALAHAPDLADTRFKLGITRLRQQDFARGWDAYEWRWRTAGFDAMRRDYPQPRWRGEKLEGPLLVWGEQGLGDHILFAGMFPDLAPLVGGVVVETEARLISLFSRSFPGVEFVARRTELNDITAVAQIPAGSLGQYLRPRDDAFPYREHGYLVPDPARAASLRTRLDDGRLVVGLSWRSRNPRYERSKSASLSDFGALLRLPHCRFVDLQYGDTGAEREVFEREHGVRIEHLHDLDNTNDIDGLAALIAACDLTVTVSNTTAHLSGALGKLTFVLVPFGYGRMWCWFGGRDDSPWYPRVRLMRQRRSQPWADTVEAIAGEIAARRPGR